MGFTKVLAFDLVKLAYRGLLVAILVYLLALLPVKDLLQPCLLWLVLRCINIKLCLCAEEACENIVNLSSDY